MSRKLTLPHHHTAHEHLNRPNPFQRNFPLARRLPQPQLMPQLLLTDRIRVVNLVTQNQERHFLQLFHAEEGVELDFRFGQALEVLGVDEEDDAANFGEVVFPEAAG